MAFNLIDSIKSLMGRDLVLNASSLLDEEESKVQRGISAIIPSVLTGILNKASSGDTHEVLKMSKEATDSGVFSGNTSLLSSNHLLARGADFVKNLFGDRMSEVTNAIAVFSGMRATAVASLLSAATPAALADLGRQAEEKEMNTSDFLGFLNTQKDNILNAVPSGLNLASAFGLNNLSGIGGRLTAELSRLSGAYTPKAMYSSDVYERKKSGPWIIPAILVTTGICILWYLLGNNKNNDTIVSASSPDTVVTTKVSEMTSPPAMESIKVMLPNGKELDAYKGGIEDKLVAFLNDPSKKADKNIWFDFDHLNFEFNSASITPESMKQVQNIVAILQAFPNASIKIGGYTDKTGDEPANMKLSKERANAVASALKVNGITDHQVTGAEGYGSQFATEEATAPDELRKKDRRISVSPRKK